ncbi:Aldo-keto reductase [Mycena kentingensis (nom. inval.)]|nr:Aldo-keto reductase [Mycena kentingensis (nom. inval.)]
MVLPTRKIGNAQVAEIGFGAMGLAAFYGKVESDEGRFKVLDAAYEAGCRHWDTAYIYGDSEDLIGKWFKRTGKRDDIFLATKGGEAVSVGSDGAYVSAADGSAEFIRSQVDTSLARLGVEHIDLYYIHRIDPRTPIEVTVGALKELVKEGKIRAIGLSECSAKCLRRAHAVYPIAALQIEYSPFVLDIEFPEVGLLAACRELGVTVVAYAPLGRGLLTGRYTSPEDFDADDYRRVLPKFSKENFPKILDVVARLRKIGERHRASAAQVTLAWMLAQGQDIVLIPGTRSVKYLKENIGGSAVRLSADEVAAVRKIAEESQTSITGKRYPDEHMAGTFVDSLELPIAP